MQINSSRYGSIALAPLIPDNIPGPLLPGSSALFCERDFGTMLIQEYKTEHFSIRYSIFNFFKKITLLFKDEKTGIISRLAIKSNANIKTENKDKLQLKEGQFAPDLPGQFAPDWGGQLRPDRGGHIDRIFQLTMARIRGLLMILFLIT